MEDDTNNNYNYQEISSNNNTTPNGILLGNTNNSHHPNHVAVNGVKLGTSPQPSLSRTSSRDSQLSAKKLSSPPLPQAQQIDDLRRRFLDEIQSHPDLYDACDVERVKTRDVWVSRFLNFLDQGPERAFDHMKETFQWRRSFGINSFDPLEIPREVYQMGPVFLYQPDDDGRNMLYVRVKMHRKLPQLEDRIKKCFLNYIERVDRKSNREFGFNIVFDMTGSGFQNADMDMLFFVLPAIRRYYPNGVKTVYILGLPWILNSLAKFALAIIPSDTARKVRFVTQQEFQEVLPSEKIPDFLGGTGPGNYRRVPRGAKDCFTLGYELYGMTTEEVTKLLKPSLKYIEEGAPLTTEVATLWEFDDND